MNDENVENKRKNNKDISFFKKVLISIKDFDKYGMFAEETVGKNFKYLLQIILVFAIVLVAVSMYNFANTLKNAVESFDNKIETLSYEDGNLKVNNNEEVEFYGLENFVGKIIINTTPITDQKMQEYKDDLSDKSNEIMLLQDRILLKNMNLAGVNEIYYQSALEKYNITNLDKQGILNYYYSNKATIYSSVGITMFIYMFVIYFINVLLDALILGFLCYITAKIAKMDELKYRKII